MEVTPAPVEAVEEPEEVEPELPKRTHKNPFAMRLNQRSNEPSAS